MVSYFQENTQFQKILHLVLEESVFIKNTVWELLFFWTVEIFILMFCFFLCFCSETSLPKTRNVIFWRKTSKVNLENFFPIAKFELIGCYCRQQTNSERFCQRVEYFIIIWKDPCRYFTNIREKEN